MSFATRMSFKVPFAENCRPDVAAVIRVFHRWISDNVLDDILIDVADYSHVPQGPAVILIGHQGHYRIDGAEGVLGFEYDHKRSALDREETGHLLHVFKRTVDTCLLLAEHLRPESGEIFSPIDRIRFQCNDRLRAPVDAESRDHYRRLLREVLTTPLEGGMQGIEVEEQSYRVELAVKLAPAVTLPRIAGNLSVTAQVGG